MDKNKFVDNLNFIKIYFKVFIYKIIVLKKPELSRKEIKKIIDGGWNLLGSKYLGTNVLEL